MALSPGEGLGDFDRTAALIRESEVGRSVLLEGPFGRRRLLYADLIATGRALTFVERWVDRAREHYANTHTAVSTTGAHMTRLRESARDIIAREVGAGPDDRVLFCGSGATAAVHKLVGLLGLRISEPLERAFRLDRHIPAGERPVVFVGPYEHHSNELPWRESIAEVVTIALDDAGQVDLEDLERQLIRRRDRALKIGTFSAASNVTGLLTDVSAIARLLHRYEAFAIFDFAASGPYVPIDMHPGDDPGAHLDAVFLSPHKFMGGPGASGLLVANTALFRTRTPERPGGGTVEYVSRSGEPDYARDLHEREEGGTPAILGDLRAAMAFLVKRMLGPEDLRAHEVALARMALSRLSRHPRIGLLGPLEADRLAVVSFNIDGLHHDLVSALLDHLFGIQNRAGCACAGPYGHRLLGIDEPRSERFRRLIQGGVLGMKPGWVRLSLPYFATPDTLDFILDAVEFVADHGEVFVPAYRFSWCDGVWRHLEAPAVSPPITLDLESLLDFAESERGPRGEALARPEQPPLDDASLAAERRGYLEAARSLAQTLAARWEAAPPRWNPPTGDPEVDALVWFRYVHAS